MNIKSKIKNILLKNPRINPYRFSADFSFRYMTNSLRTLPSFLIIGVSKSGKFSVLSYLNQHPDVIAGVKNRVGTYYFDTNFDTKSLSWYKSHFSMRFYKKIVGEAPGTYIYHPLAPTRVKKTIPNVKLINFFRNPVLRAYSAYNHSVIEGWEHSSFEDAINSELERINIKKTKEETELDNIDYVNNLQYSYLRHGLYANNLEKWLQIFPKTQFKHYSTEELDENYDKIINSIFKFINVRPIKLKKIERQHVGNFKGEYSPMKESTRNFLIKFYKPHNEKLFQMIGKKFEWDD